ncbi:MAG TPA: type II secretion system protein [Polyangiaceae bacterium]|jgi:type IV pilus assembly protein PilA|nr:type II secretion system protein [Polyangiaceae bacterium]
MRTQRTTQAGFTLVELMAVVVIVGVLATLAVFGVRKYIASSKTSEAIEMIGAIKAAEETYKDETFTYLDVSGGLTQATAYPSGFTPGRQKAQWGGGGTGSTGFKQLGVTSANPVYFAYACTAGAANTTPASPSSDSGSITIANWPTTLAAPWYVVKAYSDLSGTGVYTVFVGTSFTGDIFSANN